MPPHSHGAPFFSTLFTASAKRMPMAARTIIEAIFISTFQLFSTTGRRRYALLTFLPGRNTAQRQKASISIAAAVQNPNPQPIASMPIW